MEYVNCNLCGLDNARVLFGKKDKFSITEDEFNVVECQGCGLLYINPRPSQEEIGKFYPQIYSWKETFEAESFFTKCVRTLEKGYRYHLLQDEVSKVVKFTGRGCGKVLDIGCGTGDRLDVFRSKGYETYGVETSDSADYAKEHLKLEVEKGDLFSAQFPDRFFDIVTLYNVLEHTHDPLKVCQEIHRILKDSGSLVIQVPNKDSFQCKIFKRRWAAFDVPRDLYYFGIETLSSLLEKAGFALKGIDHFMNWWHPPTLVLSLFQNLDPQQAWGKENQGGSPVFQRMAWGLCTLLTGPLTQLESVLRRGAIVTYYGVKIGEGAGE
ncbi:MAG TPA: class I SAM-dependent methyltransferase [Thermodesulfobacteriota bacterium]|nr:class I SAM-dependent methyltransferase [Thermodesulfobacteriota bacterium]